MMTRLDTARDPAAFLRWVKAQDPTEPYCYTNPFGCPFARFLRQLGFVDASVGPRNWDAWVKPSWFRRGRRMFYRLDPRVSAALSSRDGRTYGALARRLEAAHV